MGVAALVWLIIGIILMIGEIVIPGAILVFLGMASVIVALLLHYGVITSLVTATLAWFIISLVLLLVLRSLFLKLMPGNSKVQGTDEDKDAEGSIVKVTEEIRPEVTGRIDFRDCSWEAESEFMIRAGQEALVVGRNGKIWIVKPIEE